jgi:hypothetical protein
MTQIGFKEWKVVCEAIASGRQDVIFRKGGIHEGKAGFSFKHSEFYLFPTLFHAQTDFVTEGEALKTTEWQNGDKVQIECFCRAVKALTLTNWEDVLAYQERHIWTEQTIRERFDWEGKGMATGSIHVAELEVFRLERPFLLEYAPKYGGCRSWIDLPDEIGGFKLEAIKSA